MCAQPRERRRCAAGGREDGSSNAAKRCRKGPDDALRPVDSPSPGIAKTHANTERWVVDFQGVYGATPAGNLLLMQDTIANRVVPMPGNWDGTCDEDPATLAAIVDTWIAEAATWQQIDPFMILNVANEWGLSDSGFGLLALGSPATSL